MTQAGARQEREKRGPGGGGGPPTGQTLAGGPQGRRARADAFAVWVARLAPGFFSGCWSSAGSAHPRTCPHPHMAARREAPGVRGLPVYRSLTLSSEPLQGGRAAGWGTPVPGPPYPRQEGPTPQSRLCSPYPLPRRTQLRQTAVPSTGACPSCLWAPETRGILTQ